MTVEEIQETETTEIENREGINFLSFTHSKTPLKSRGVFFYLKK